MKSFFDLIVDIKKLKLEIEILKAENEQLKLSCQTQSEIIEIYMGRHLKVQVEEIKSDRLN